MAALPSLFDIPLWVETELALPGVCDLLAGDTPSAEDAADGLPLFLDADTRPWTLSSLRASSPVTSDTGLTDADDALAAGFGGDLEEPKVPRSSYGRLSTPTTHGTKQLSPATCGAGCTQCVPRPSLAAPRLFARSTGAPLFRLPHRTVLVS
jgi:hypothetical protein